MTPRMMSLGVHLRIIGRPGRIGYLERFIQHASAASGCGSPRARRSPSTGPPRTRPEPPPGGEGRAVASIQDAILGLSDHVARTGARTSRRLVGATKTFLLDTLGVGVAGSAGPWVEELVEASAGGAPRRHATGSCPGHALPAPAAALANAYQIHNSEFDCVHEPAVVHAMTAVLAAALAHAERQRGSARARTC